MSPISPTDDGPHPWPAEATGTWTETWSLAWNDADTGVGGLHEIRIDRARGVAAVQWWTHVDGSGTTRSDVAELLPAASFDGDIGDLRIGDVTIRTLESLRSATVRSPGVDLRYTAVTAPIRFSMSGQRLRRADDHYESFGSVSGTVRVGQRVIGVSGGAFHRHEWGPATPAAAPVQSAHCFFSEDLFLAVAEYRTPAGVAPLGYLYEGEEFHGVEKLRFRTELDDDGNPRGCDLLIATADRRDFRVPGEVSAVLTGPQEAMALTTFSLGGRRRGGLLRVRRPDNEADNGG